jgi:hypothetical protein
MSFCVCFWILFWWSYENVCWFREMTLMG